MPRLFCLLFVLFSLLTLAPSAPCQTQSADFTAALSGDKHPLSLKLKDLDGSWRSFNLIASADAANQVTLYLGLLTGGVQNHYYTQGVTETLGGEIYLVAYRQTLSIDYAALVKGDISNPPPTPKPTPDTALSLSLLNLRQVGSMNDIQPFSLSDTLNPPPPPPAVVAHDQAVASESNLKQLGLAMLQYEQDSDEKLPPLKTAAIAKTALYPYVKSNDVFVQTGTQTLYQPNTSLSHRSLASFNSPSDMVAYYEATPGGDGLRAVLFLDGHVKRVTDADWRRLKTASHVPNPPQGVQ